MLEELTHDRLIGDHWLTVTAVAYEPRVPARMDCHPDYQTPAEGGLWEFEVTQDGEWTYELQRLVTHNDWCAIQRQFNQTAQALGWRL